MNMLTMTNSGTFCFIWSYVSKPKSNTYLNVVINKNQTHANGRCGRKAHAGLK